MLKRHQFRKVVGENKPLMSVVNVKIYTKNKKGSLIQTIRLYSQDIGMKFGIEKYAREMGNSRRNREVSSWCNG